MPISIKDYSWRQTAETVIIQIPLKEYYLKRADVFTTSNYLKVNSPPYLFEVCLWQPVLDVESSCKVGNEKIVFQLVKETQDTWPSLSANLTPHEVQQIKVKAIEESQRKAESNLKACAARKDAQQKSAVRKQISLNTQEQDFIKHARERELTEALSTIGWAYRSQESTVKIMEVKEKHLLKKETEEIFSDSTKTNNMIPAPRNSTQIAVSFSPRWFPTPCRESKMFEEQEWLKNQAEARRKTGFVVEDLRLDEQDPIWLCDKAQNFYKVGNYLGAVSAYTHALTLNNHLYTLYEGRAAAYLALGNLHKSLQDSSKALELLTPPVTENAEARARCMLYRGIALTNLGLQSEALGELRAAEHIMPDCPNIQTAISQLKM